MSVEKECTRCHKVFLATQESQDVCADCLADEFGSGVVSKDFDHASLVKNNIDATRRQQARASHQGRILRSGAAFSMSGHVRCGLAVFLFLLCVFMFILSDGSHRTFLNQLDYEYQLLISLGTALFSSLLLYPSFGRHKVVVVVLWCIMLLMGATLPSMCYYKVAEATSVASDSTFSSAADTDETGQNQKTTRVLPDDELAFFYDLKKSRPKSVHYSVFVKSDAVTSDFGDGILAYGRMEQSVRNLIKSSLSRMFHGAKVEINNVDTGQGVLFTVINVPAERKNITSLLGLFGDVYYSDAAEGIYELTLSNEKVRIGEESDPAVLLNVNHPGFAELNMNALRSLNPEIVRAAAKRLADANVNALRSDIANRVKETLQYSWLTEPDTFNALVEVLVVYAPQGDPQVTDILWNYFKENIRARRSVSNEVVARLAHDDPERMRTPVLKLWQANPLAWNDIAGILVNELQPYMIEQLSGSGLSVKEITDYMNYLELYGTEAALPTIQRYVNHQDKAISRKASNTRDSIMGRKQD